MVSKSQVGVSLQDFVDDVGIMDQLVVDGASEQTGPKSEFMKAVRRLHIKLRQTEPYTPWQNDAERKIGEVKKRWRHRMITRKVPRRLWDYGLVYEAEILSRMAKGPDGRTGIEQVTGDTPDISEWLDFDFYDLVWYWDSPHLSMTDENPKLGRWLGVAHRIGSDMCYWIINEKGNVLARTTVQHVPEIDLKTDQLKAKAETFEKALNDRLNDANFVAENAESEGFYMEDVTYDDDEMEEVNAVEQDDYTDDAYDQYVGAELLLPHGDQMVHGKVIKRARGEDGNPIGKRNMNPILDTREYEVELSDGSIAEYAANVIAENLYSQVDSEGRQYLILNEIVDHSQDASAISKDQGFYTSYNGNQIRRKTTKGWKLCVEWKDGSTSWIPLSELKASNPVEVAEYAVANHLIEEPAFAWWTKDVLRRRNRIISKVKSRYWKTTHKFGIRLPHSVQQALQIDEETGTDYWRRAIEREMKNVRPAFERWDEGTVEDARDGKKLVGYQEIGCHMVFDIKMDFTRKARYVAGGNTTEPPTENTYSSVVSRESVRIALLVAALNDLQICAADVTNAYINADCREKIWTIAGPEFGATEQGSVMVIKKALYGLKSSGAAWRALFAMTLTEMGYMSTKADPDVWIRPQVKPDGFEYYEMVLVYVDDIMVLSHDTKPTMDAIASLYKLKEGSVGEPTQYLGANVGKYQLPDGRECWSMSGRDYVKNAVKNVETMLEKEGMKLRSKADRPMPSGYRPEVDVSNELAPDLVTRYQGLIGVLRWACELGRIDILVEVSMLSSHNAMPREGHLEAAYHVFAYLKKHENSTLVFDDAIPFIDERRFKDVDWKDFYGDVTEAIPPKMPQPRGNKVKMTTFVDSDHAGNLATRRSQTGILIFLNKAPVVWYSKRQNTVESSTFGSEFVAMRVATEMVEGLRYKLRMFGIPIDGPTDILCDNQSVVSNSSVPESTLNKKHNAICYHRVREACAAGTIRIAKEDTTTNLADIFTKPLPNPQRRFLLSRIVY
jgi:hypothetical protein